MENEALIKKNELISINNIYNICKSTVQIKYQYEEGDLTASGFFIIFQKHNKPFYCIMTNEHCISNSVIKNEKK